MAVKAPTLASHMKTLRAAALAYPGAVEEFPWGDRVFKVRKKIFVFINVHEGKLYVTAKLPASGKMALLLPFASPTGYNLGKSGWVSAEFARARDVPVDMMLAWMDESYRAVAPKKLVDELGSRHGS
ncbi:MAG TPA: MmcQ/YjbR family DNA-binding protein [Haliangiales bacterium]|nr:MmcQ/YjbR family DNA-binding protein [Haliangiales bacterium]